jgi:hypothetical protein
MYSYGPFDSAVLSDLTSAEALNVIQQSPIEFPGGYGYRIKPGTRAEFAKKNAALFLSRHLPDVEWLFGALGSLNSSELELAGSIVYADREFADLDRHPSISEVATRLLEIKPRFTRVKVEHCIESLLSIGALTATVRVLGKVN